MLIYAECFYATICDSRYDKIWETRDRTHCTIYFHRYQKSNEKIIVRNYRNNILAFKKDNYDILLDFDFCILFFKILFFLYIVSILKKTNNILKLKVF